MANALVPEVVTAVPEAKAVRLTREGKPFREQRRGKIDALPDPVRGELDGKLAADSCGDYRGLSQWLEEEHSARISPSAINYRKKHKIDLQLLPVKYATEEAQKIVAATGGDNEEFNRVLTMVVQSKIFDLLIEVNRALAALDQLDRAKKHSRKVREGRARKKGETVGESKYPLKLMAVVMSAMTRNTTEIGTHLRAQEKWELQREELIQKIEAASRTVSKLATEAGLSRAAEEKIRAALMEIKL
jgi:hypothetical protein